MSNEGPRIGFNFADYMEGQYKFATPNDPFDPFFDDYEHNNPYDDLLPCGISSYDQLENDLNFWSEQDFRFESDQLAMEPYNYPPLISSSVTVIEESQNSTYTNILRQNFYNDQSPIPHDPLYCAQFEAENQYLLNVNGSDLLPFSMLAPSVKENQNKKKEKDAQPNLIEFKLTKRPASFRKSDRNVAIKGVKFKTQEELINTNQYTEEEANTCITAFENNAGTPEEQSIRRATHSGKRAGKRGSRLPSDQELMKRYHGDETLIEAYKEAYREADKKIQRSFTEPKSSNLKKAHKAGCEAAKNGVKLKTQEELIKKNKYTEEQAKIYIEAYKQNAGTPEEQIIRGATHSGKQAGRRGCRLPCDQILKKKYHDDESLVEAYKEAYNEAYKKIQPSFAESKSANLKKARNAGCQAARIGAKRKTQQELTKNNKYTAEEVNIYIKAFKQIAGTPEEQAMRGATYSGRQAGRRGSRLPSDEKLMKKYHDDESLVKAYKQAYLNCNSNKNIKKQRQPKTLQKPELLPLYISLKDDLEMGSSVSKPITFAYKELKSKERQPKDAVELQKHLVKKHPPIR